MEQRVIPWLLAGLTAGWFCWMGVRAGRNPALWGVGGAAFGLVTSAIVFGLAQARTIFYSAHDRRVGHIEWLVIAVLLILVFGWLLTLSLHRHHLAVWRKFNPESAPAQSSAVEAKPASPAKQPAQRA